MFDIHSKIDKVADDESIQSVSYNFKNMNELLFVHGTMTVDFIGVVHFCGPMKEK